MPPSPAIRLAAILILGLALSAVMSGRAELVDVSSQGAASQSSEWNGGQFPAALAIDGNAGTFSHTAGTGGDDAWTLRLDQDYEVARIELVMRASCCGGRLTGATLRLFDREGDSVFDEVISDPGPGGVAVFPIPPGTEARRVRVAFEDGATNPGQATTYLHLGEVRVFAEIDLLPNILSFQASPATIAGGETSTVSWQVENTDSVELIGVGAVAESGSLPIKPVKSEVFTLVVSNAHGSRSRSIGVLVDDVLLSPRLSEFMANNAATVVRSDGATPDWIEIWNPNPVEIDLGGYELTDDAEEPAKFTFPTMLLAAESYLIVDADTLARDGFLATGFKLDKDADSYLALHDPAGQLLQSFLYPKQREDVSYGLDWHGEEKFFLQPTPGEPGVTGSVEGFVADTQFSVDRGYHDDPIVVAITSATPLAAIYTTTDGSEPSPGNPAASLYTGPLTIDATTVLRAAAFRENYLPTDVDTQTYLFAEQVEAQSSSPANFPPRWVPNLSGVQSAVPAYAHFGMDDGVIASLPLVDRAGARFDLRGALLAIPTMSLVMNSDELLHPVAGLHVNARNRGRAWERRASLEYIDPVTGATQQANCGLRMHGGWNRFPEMLKKSFRFYFRDEYGDAKFKAPLFPGGVTDEFDRVLLRSGNGKAWPSPWRALAGGGNSLERNTYLRDQFLRDLQAEMGNDHAAGRFVHLFVNGHYWGLYNSVERVDEHMASSHFGGKDEDYDVVKWIRGSGHQMAAGETDGWNELIALARGDTRNPATYAAIGERLDLPNFIDYMMLNFYAGNQDWVDSNAYALRDRANNGPFKFYCWDSEETFLSPGRDSTEQRVSDTSTELHHTLRLNPEYRVLFGDRAQKHFFNDGALTQARSDETLMRRAWEVDRAIVGDSARWGNLLRPADPYDREDWLDEIENLRTNYLGPRVDTTLAQLRADGLFPSIDPPLFRPQHGGQVASGSVVVLSIVPPQGGTVYFTTDGSDPRLAGGAISPTALPFIDAATSAIAITDDTLVRARVLEGANWSALDEALYLVGDRAADLYLAELMYHPGPTLPGEAEFIELGNRGGSTHDLGDLRLTGGIQLDFADEGVEVIAPGERLVFARDRTAFALAYPGVALAGAYRGALANGGDSFSLEEAGGDVLWTFTFGDSSPWPGGTDGGGHSLTYAGGDQNDPSSWRPSANQNGSPGESDAIAFPGGNLLEYAEVAIDVVLNSAGVPEFVITSRLGTDDVLVTAQWSEDLENWSGDNLVRSGRSPVGGHRAREVWTLEGPARPELYVRAVVSTR